MAAIEGAEFLPFSLKVLLENTIRQGGGTDRIEALLHSPRTAGLSTGCGSPV